MINMDKITKFIQAFKTHFNRNRTRKGDEDEGQEEPKEAAAAEDNQSPGDVRMNSGVHKKVYGVRRKILGFTVVGLLLAFSLSYLFFQSDNSKTPRRPSGSSAQESKMPSHMGEDATKDELSYRDLRALDQRGQAARNVPGQPPHTGDPTAVGGANGVSRTPAAAGAQAYGAPAQSSTVYATPMPSVPSPSAAVGGSAAGTGSGSSAAASAEDRAAAELQKRFASAIDFALGRSTAAADAPAAEAAAPQPTADVPAPPASNTLQTANLSMASASPYTLQAGTLIPAMLFTGIDTSVPGQVMAQISTDVYDSLTQSNLLIPAGARLLGTYKSDGGASNGRVNVVFSTLILPNGSAYDIGTSMVAVDGGGYSGIVGKLHRHTSRVIGAGMISSAIAALGSLASGNTSARDTYTGGQVAMQGALANLISTTSNMLSQGTDAQPNVTVEPGHMFQVYVIQPIAFGTP